MKFFGEVGYGQRTSQLDLVDFGRIQIQNLEFFYCSSRLIICLKISSRGMPINYSDKDVSHLFRCHLFDLPKWLQCSVHYFVAFPLLQIWVTFRPRPMCSLERSDPWLEEKGQTPVHQHLHCRQTDCQATVALWAVRHVLHHWTTCLQPRRVLQSLMWRHLLLMLGSSVLLVQAWLLVCDSIFTHLCFSCYISYWEQARVTFYYQARCLSVYDLRCIFQRWTMHRFQLTRLPPPPVGAGGGYMFSGRPSVPLSVRASVCPCVRPWFTW